MVSRRVDDRRYHYWLVAQVDGKPVLIYGAPDEPTARQRGFDMLPGTDFELKRLPTRNLQRASSLLKGNKLERKHSLRDAMQKLGHDRTLRRRLEKRRTGPSWS